MNPSKSARKIVADTLRELPVELQEAARSVPVCLEGWPNDALVEEGLDPGILGLFVGLPRHQQDSDPGPPPQIILYLENILDECDAAGTTFEEEVRRTYLHELGHYLGLDEEELADRDLD